MRQLRFGRAGARGARGLTLIEVLVGLAITAMLLGLGVPYLGDFVINARLREAGHSLLAETLATQSEAIKRNVTMRLVISGSSVEQRDMSSGGTGTLVRATSLPETVRAVAAVTMSFGSDGRPTPFAQTFAVDLEVAGGTCSAEQRCPGLRVDGGGAVRLCPNRLSGCP